MRGPGVKPSDYVAVLLWGLYLGSYAYFIEDEQTRAHRGKAPDDALYYSHGLGQWVTLSDLPNDHPFRLRYAGRLAEAYPQ